MFRKFLFALIVGVPCLATSALADEYAAIAYSPSTGNTGWGYGYSSLGDAKSVALSRCGAADAVIKVWSVNGYCALAKGDDGSLGWGWGNSRAEAETIAMNHCTSGSHVIAWTYSGEDSSYYYYYYYY